MKVFLTVLGVERETPTKDSLTGQLQLEPPVEVAGLTAREKESHPGCCTEERKLGQHQDAIENNLLRRFFHECEV